MGEIDPAFTFEFDAGDAAPWELGGAISDLGGAPSRAGASGAKRRRGAAQAPPAPVSDSEEEDEGDDASEASEDNEPLEAEGEESDGSDDTEQAVEEEAAEPPAAGQRHDRQQRAPERGGRGDGGAAGPASTSQARGSSFYDATPADVAFSARSFADMNLSRQLVRACSELGFVRPTPIQAACIPLVLMGRDICGSAITGSGKTAAFGLPLLERLLFRSRKVATIYALVLTPTRELAVQVQSMLQKLAQFTDIRVALVVGGLSLQVQATTLRSNPEVVVATPGRLIDHLRNTQSVDIDDLQALVMDEADRLLEMGFQEEVREIVRLAPRKRQTLLFSATMSEEVKSLAALSLQRPIRLAADAQYAAPAKLVQEVVRVKGAAVGMKEAVLLALCSRGLREGRAIVFFRTKRAAHRARLLFGLAGLPPAAELHGDMSQAARLESLEQFRKGEAAYLLATDVASRGLDILGVDSVVSFDAPTTIAAYMHRIGRTARAGAAGRAVTFVEDGDRKLMKQVVKQQGAQLQERVISTASAKAWAAKIEALEPDVRRLEQEEREEKQLRQAEMVMQKAENMVEHEAEIYARPARTWFQSAAQKRGAADKAGERNAHKRARGREAERGSAGKKPRLMEETAAAAKAIRAVKSNEKALRQQGVAPRQAQKLALSKVAGKAAAPKAKKQRAKGKDAEGAFEGSCISGAPTGPSKVYAGGRRSGSAAPAKAGVSKQDRSKAKRQGKGRNAFKSKARHKRR